MREVTIKLVTDPGDKIFHVRVNWSPESGIEIEDSFVREALRPCLNLMLKTLLPGNTGYGEGNTAEAAKQRAFIERDILMANSEAQREGIPRDDLPDLKEHGLTDPRQVGDKSKLTYDDIRVFIHCEHCIKELPPGTSPAEFTAWEVGLAHNGKLAVYCKRHKIVAGEFTLKNPPTVGCACAECHEPIEFDQEEK